VLNPQPGGEYAYQVKPGKLYVYQPDPTPTLVPTPSVVTSTSHLATPISEPAPRSVTMRDHVVTVIGALMSVLGVGLIVGLWLIERRQG
jgi:hypothetical protein